jgi:hypothetical protein
MFYASRIRRSALLGALTCALLAATTGDVAAQTPDDAAIARALAQERSYMGVANEEAVDSVPSHESTVTRSAAGPQLTAAQAQERYYSSYGEPEPITAPLAPAPANRTPWLTIALAAAAALAAGTIAAIHRRRLRLRRRVARAMT